MLGDSKNNSSKIHSNDLLEKLENSHHDQGSFATSCQLGDSKNSSKDHSSDLLGNSENNSHHDQGSFANSYQKCLSKMVIENCRANLDLTTSQLFSLLDTQIKKHNL
jgi:hypothetical protein